MGHLDLYKGSGLRPFGGVGAFDSIFDVLTGFNGASVDYPKSNMFTENGKHFLEFAVAGYKPSEISVTIENNILSVSSEKMEYPERKYYHQGISQKYFKKSYKLSDDIDADSIVCTFKDGMLLVELPVKEPIKPKVRTIQIGV